MTILPYLLCFILLVAGLCIFFIQKKKTREQQKIRSLQKKVQAALEDDSVPEPTTTPFASKLSDAGMTTKLQRPSLQLQSGSTGEPPEKYKFFSNLVAKGMQAEEIAEILNISTTEASQLVQLCGLNSCRN